jgi:hypothetical protein
MDGFEIRIINRDALDNMIQGLSLIDKDKSIRAGLKAGGNVLKRGGIRRLKARMKNSKGVTGNLLRSFEVRVKKNSLGVIVGFHEGDKGDIKNGYHAYLVDLGTQDRFQVKTGRHVGAAKALHFWTDTKSEDMQQAQGMIMQGIERFVMVHER